MRRSWKVRGAQAGSTVGIVGLTMLRLSGKTIRWSSAAVAFTPYVVPAGVAFGGFAVVRRQRALGAILGGSAAVIASLTAPRARPPAQPRARGPLLTIMSANVYKGRADAEALVALVRQHQPDVLAIQEQNPRFIAELRQAGLFTLLPHHVIGDGGRLADGSLFSRHRLEAFHAELPSEYVAGALTLPDGKTLPLICAHPLPPSSPRYEGPWIRSLEELPEPSGWMAGGVVVGDFNATLDHPEFRAVLATGWRDAGREQGGGLTPTWGGYGLLRLTLDHILVPPGTSVQAYRVDRLSGSDHRAITATIMLPS